MNTKTAAKATRAKKSKKPKNYDTLVDDSPSRDCLRKARMEDDHYMLVLGKYLVSLDCYELVVSRFDGMYDNLIDDIEYLPAELVGGNPIHEFFPGLDGTLETVLCLKHMASLPGARIQEVDWGTFALAE